MFAVPRYITRSFPDKSVDLSIIIPARNEAHNLPKLLQSINDQDLQKMEIIVADDGSTDKTKKIATEYGARVIDVPTDEWQGKSHACYIGAQHAQHEYLIFMDADTELSDVHSLSHICAQYEQQDSLGVLSVQPYHQTVQQYETLSVIFNIVTVVGMNIFSKFHKKMQTNSVFGPFIMTNRKDYFASDAHKEAKDTIIEGMGIYHAYEALSLPITLYLGHNILKFRMYPEGTGSLIDGWKKHIASGSSNARKSIMGLIMLWMGVSIITPLYLLFTIVWSQNYIIMGIILYLAYAVQFRSISQKLINISWYHALIHPIYVLFFFSVYGTSFIQTHIFKKVRWKGREIDLKNK